MFSILWRFFPGPVWLRLVVMLAVLAGIVYALVYYGDLKSESEYIT